MDKAIDSLIPLSGNNGTKGAGFIFCRLLYFLLAKNTNMTSFNPRTREGCDLALTAPSARSSVFQSTHPRGVRLVPPRGLHRRTSKFQSTHPRGVRRPSGLAGRSRADVSIHAPARGATKHLVQRFQFPGVSIHAPARGATVYTVEPCGVLVFQSTHPRGVRHGIPMEIWLGNHVSIHAPARGATFL